MIKKELKPFDIEKAKAGATIVTRDYKPVRILTYDCKSDIYPIIALMDAGGVELIGKFTITGEYILGSPLEYNLFILEENDHIDFEEIYDCEQAVRNYNKIVAISKLFTIADYYNKLTGLTVNWNNHYSSKFCIYYDHEINQYVADAWLTSNYGMPCFLNEKDAQAVIDNPNFKPILDTIFK